jgi:uncharacterized Zn finger protein
MSPSRGGSDWDSWPTSSPRLKVEGGLKARSARGAIGESWWSRRFLDILESFALGTRLTRGRNYARAGQVISLDVTRGAVKASVQGSRPKPYDVVIGLAPFSELVWAKVEVALAEQALFSAQLLSGEVPQSLDDVFAAAGAALFPRALRDMSMRCSCPDGAVPCKHIAATFYLLAEAFDADPFQILLWRGRDKEALLRRLRALRSGGEPSPVPTPTKRSRTRAVARDDAPAPVGAALALADIAGSPLADSVDRFWNPPIPLPARHVTVETEPDLLLRQLPPPGRAIGGAELGECIRAAYEAMAQP